MKEIQMSLLDDENFKISISYAKGICKKSYATHLNMNHVLCGWLIANESFSVDKMSNIEEIERKIVLNSLNNKLKFLNVQPIIDQSFPLDSQLKLFISKNKDQPFIVFITNLIALIFTEEEKMLSTENNISDDYITKVQFEKSFVKIDQNIDKPFFNINLGKTYYRTGFINVGIDSSGFLDLHDCSLKICLGSDDNVIYSRIDRKANFNGSVRVIGQNSKIADWFSKNFSEGDIVRCKIIDKNTLFLFLNK